MQNWNRSIWKISQPKPISPNWSKRFSTFKQIRSASSLSEAYLVTAGAIKTTTIIGGNISWDFVLTTTPWNEKQLKTVTSLYNGDKAMKKGTYRLEAIIEIDTQWLKYIKTSKIGKLADKKQYLHENSFHTFQAISLCIYLYLSETKCLIVTKFLAHYKIHLNQSNVDHSHLNLIWALLRLWLNSKIQYQQNK